MIELLVVIAIITAILFPVFARARENARRTSYLNNVKQIGLAFMQYTQDYDEMYPMIGFNTGHTVRYSTGNSAQIFNCPSNAIAPWTGGTSARPVSNTSYGANARLLTSAISLAAVEKPFQRSANPAQSGAGRLLVRDAYFLIA